MTGFGRAEATCDLGRFTVEIKSVNSRFLEPSFHLPREISGLEYTLRSHLKSHLSRGKLDCRVRFDPAQSHDFQARVNEKVILQYLEHLRALRTSTQIAGEITLDTLLGLPGAVEAQETGVDVDAYWAALLPVVNQAITNYNDERRREGEELGHHLLADVDFIRARRNEVLAARDQILARFRDKLRERIAELEEETRATLEPGRLELEVSMYADRCDVSEELVRLDVHLTRFTSLVANKDGKPVGKAMDFLLQEILREVNTTASKSRDLDLSQATLDMKSAVERIREQIQNIE